MASGLEKLNINTIFVKMSVVKNLNWKQKSSKPKTILIKGEICILRGLKNRPEKNRARVKIISLSESNKYKIMDVRTSE